MRLNVSLFISLLLILMVLCVSCGRSFGDERGLTIHRKKCSKVRDSHRGTHHMMQTLSEVKTKPADDPIAKIRRRMYSQNLELERGKIRTSINDPVRK